MPWVCARKVRGCPNRTYERCFTPDLTFNVSMEYDTF